MPGIIERPYSSFADAIAFEEQAQKAGYRALGNGNYKKIGSWWEAPISGQELQGKLSSQRFAQQQSTPENLVGNTDYLAQIQQYIAPQGASVDAVGSSQTNPYDKRLQELINNPNAISDSNAYKFRFNEGQRALERGAAAKGMLGSGNTLAALAQYGQGMASDEYGNEVARLSALSGQRDSRNLEQQQLNQRSGALALSALSGANDQRLRANELATRTATSTGLVRPNIW